MKRHRMTNDIRKEFNYEPDPTWKRVHRAESDQRRQRRNAVTIQNRTATRTLGNHSFLGGTGHDDGLRKPTRSNQREG